MRLKLIRLRAKLAGWHASGLFLIQLTGNVFGLFSRYKLNAMQINHYQILLNKCWCWYAIPIKRKYNSIWSNLAAITINAYQFVAFRSYMRQIIACHNQSQRMSQKQMKCFFYRGRGFFLSLFIQAAWHTMKPFVIWYCG